LSIDFLFFFVYFYFAYYETILITQKKDWTAMNLSNIAESIRKTING